MENSWPNFRSIIFAFYSRCYQTCGMTFHVAISILEILIREEDLIIKSFLVFLNYFYTRKYSYIFISFYLLIIIS